MSLPTAPNGRPRAVLSWSSGKDSAWTLHVARQQREVEIVALMTTVNVTHARVAMHGVRDALLERQAEEAGLPLVRIPIPSPCSNDEYDRALSRALADLGADGIRTCVFGDLFLADLRAWREQRLRDIGWNAVFPLWMRPTGELAREMIAGGLRALLTCVDPKQLPSSFAGRDFDGSLLADLPASVDPCGERGEFHSFAWSGPMFRRPIAITRGEVVERDGFVFADVVPA